jgi:hypothetical protein
MTHPRVCFLAIGCAFLILSLAATSLPAQKGDEFRSLLNGKDLTGWDGDPRFWSVKDGAITGMTTAENPAPGNTFLIWRGGTLKDFELRLQFRIQGGNSGVQYRSKDLGKWVVSGYQADIDADDQYTGNFYEERGRGILGPVGDRITVGPDGKPVKTGSVGDPKEIKAAIRKGDWNEYRIVARGNHFVQAINGRTTVEATDDDPAHRAMEGILALQLHAGPPMTVQFKEIRLKDLGSGAK